LGAVPPPLRWVADRTESTDRTVRQCSSQKAGERIDWQRLAGGVVVPGGEDYSFPAALPFRVCRFRPISV